MCERGGGHPTGGCSQDNATRGTQEGRGKDLEGLRSERAVLLCQPAAVLRQPDTSRGCMRQGQAISSAALDLNW